MMIETLLAGALMALKWFWRNAHGPGGKQFMRDMDFMADEKSKNFVEMDGKVLPSSVDCIKWFSHLSSCCTKEGAKTDEARAAIARREVDKAMSGTLKI